MRKAVDKSTSLYRLIRPVLRALPSETAHELSLWAVERGADRFLKGRAGQPPDPPVLAQRLWGLDAVCDRLSRRIRSGIVGVNLGKNRDTGEAVEDYAEGIRRVAGRADYLVVNVSSPNTPGLRELQHRAMLNALLERLIRVREEAGCQVPLLVKIAPDLTFEESGDIGQVALESGIDGLIVSNTTVGRPPGLLSRHAREVGGLSGRPLFAASNAILAEMYRLTQGRLPLIGVGGIASAEDAYAKIRAGASLVQLYTALVFAGPALVSQIKSGLAELLRRDGFATVAEAVGVAQGAAPMPQSIKSPRAVTPR